MVAWGWLVPAVLLGTAAGVAIMGLMAARGRDERCQGCLTRVVELRQEARLREEAMSHG